MEAKQGLDLGSSLLVPSVQELAKEPLIKGVPSRYVRPDQDPPIISSCSMQLQVPIIDMERLTSQDSAEYELEKLHIACKDWGFFQVLTYLIHKIWLIITKQMAITSFWIM